MRATALCIVAVCVLFFGAPRAQAQAEAEKPEKKVQIEEITVTAERREQSAQEIGAAIEAFSTEDLDRRGITDIYDLASSVPSLQVTGGLPQPTLRGVSSDVVSPGVDAPFAAHINGQYVPQLAVALLPFLDLERVEVLYGPQGTLFGHSTTGGTLNFITKKPEAALGFEAEFDYATYDKASATAILNVPLVEERVLSRLSYRHAWPSRIYGVHGPHHQGLSANSLEAGDSVRLSLSFLPTDRVRVDLVGGWVRDDSTGGAVRVLDPYPAYPTGRPYLFNNWSASADYSGATPNSDSPHEVRWDRRQAQSFSVGLAQALISIDMDWATLSMNSSYYIFDYSIDRDQDGSDLDIRRLKLLSTDIQYGQEVLLQSSKDQFFEWLIGANYYHHDAPDVDVPFFDRQITADAANFVIIRPDLSVFSAFTPLNGGPTLHAKSDSRTMVFGAFGNIWLNFTDNFRFIGGLRHSGTSRQFDDNSTSKVFVPPPGNPPGVAVLLDLEGTDNQHENWKSLTWRTALEWEPVDDSLLYASFSRGEQAGGFNFLALDPVTDPNDPVTIPPFDSEKIYALEVGSKNQFLDGRLQLNLSAYHYNYDNKFITLTVASGLTETSNAPSALVYGLELSSLYMPTDELQLNASLGLTHSEYDDDLFAVDQSLSDRCPIASPCQPGNPGFPIIDIPAGTDLPEQNLKGNRLNRTPQITLGLGAQYAFALGDWGTLTPRVDHYWRDRVYFTQFNNELDSQGSYHQTNARIRLEPTDGTYWLELYATNLQDDQKIRTQLEGSALGRQWWLAEPRMFGVRVGYRYF